MSALGKGLGALIPNKNKKTSTATHLSSDIELEQIEYVSLDQISANPWQPRTHFDREKLEELAQSIKQHGILQPLVASEENGQYQLIAGERRFKAAELLGLEEVPIIVKKVSDRDKLELAVVENIQRRNLNPIETAQSYQNLKAEFGLNAEEIAEQVGKTAATISGFLRLLKLPIVVKEALAKGDINMSHAKIILAYPDKNEQIKIYKKILNNDISISKLKEMRQKSAAKELEKKPRDPVLASWEDKLTKNIGAKVIIQKRGEKGFIKINFHSHSELKNIFDKLEE